MWSLYACRGTSFETNYTYSKNNQYNTARWQEEMQFAVLLAWRKACSFPASVLSLTRETITRLTVSHNRSPYAIPQTDKIHTNFYTCHQHKCNSLVREYKHLTLLIQLSQYSDYITNWTTQVRFPVQTQIFFPHQSIQNRSEAHSSFYPMATRG